MKKKLTLSDSELISALQNEAPVGLKALVSMYGKALYGIINNILKNEDDAEDALQIVYIKIWENSKYYNGSKGRIYTWIANIARNYAIDVTRTKKYKSKMKESDIEAYDSDSDFFHIVAESPAQKHDKAVIVQHMNALPVKNVEVLNMVYLNGFTQSEAAEYLNIPLGTVKTRLRAGLDMLRIALVKELIINEVPLQKSVKLAFSDTQLLFKPSVLRFANLVVVSTLFLQNYI